jgi:hypothetical protein
VPGKLFFYKKKVPGKLFFYGRIYLTKAGNFIAATHEAAATPGDDENSHREHVITRSQSTPYSPIFIVDDGGKLKKKYGAR